MNAEHYDVPPSLWQAQHDWAGYPPLEGRIGADVAVVGAGVTGSACARAAAGKSRRCTWTRS